MKRFLGVVYISYSSFMIYAWIFDKLKNYLAPQMQVYAKVACIPLLIIGIILLVKPHYHFKKSDLVLLLPILLFISSSNYRLTTSFAKNRIINNTQNSVKKEDNKPIEEDEPVKENKQYDFTNADFEVLDSNYDGLSSYFLFANTSSKYIGKTIKVRGRAIVDAVYVPDGYFFISKLLMTCCAADTSLAGFVVNRTNDIKDGMWYEIEGVIRKYNGDDYMTYIEIVNIKEIDSKKEEEYVYPCYTYSDDCEAVRKYNLEY